MHKKTLALAIAGILGIGAIGGGAAYAKRQHDGGHGGRHEMINLAERYDANKDGLVTQDEINTNRTAMHAKFDADKSGDLSLDEFKALWAEANKDRMVREFQRFDTDGDARATLDEYRKPLATIVADLDSNGDKALSKVDRPAHHGKRHGGHGQDDGMDNDGPGGPPPPPPAN
jgi:Ca2+-binding EF-hand superfamily protein